MFMKKMLAVGLNLFLLCLLFVPAPATAVASSGNAGTQVTPAGPPLPPSPSAWDGCPVQETSVERIPTDWIDREHFRELTARLAADETPAAAWPVGDASLPILYPTIRLDGGSLPEAEAKVQAALAGLLAELRGGYYDTELFFATEPVKFAFAAIGELLFVQVAVATDNAPIGYPFSQVLLWGVYDSHTGEAVPTGDWLARFGDAPGLRYYYGLLPRDLDEMSARQQAEENSANAVAPEIDYTEYDDDDEAFSEDDEIDRGAFDTSYNEYEHETGDYIDKGADYFHTAETYTPPPGTTCVGAWTAQMTSAEACVVLELREPDGTPRRAAIPLRYFEETWEKGLPLAPSAE